MTLPLKGIKILDFSTLLPGPYATQLLADMGADVLRIESPTRPDLVKFMSPRVGKGKQKVSAVHASLNRNKQCMAVDLKSEEAKDIIYRLVKEYDIVIEQFRPGVMKRLGLDYASLNKIQPKLIYCSITGYGQTGPLKDRAGHDINYLALSGLASYSGRKETGPVLSGTQIADIAGGSHHAVMAIQAAIIQRTVSGDGQYLDVSMSDAALALTTMFGASAIADGKSPQLGEEMLNGGLFYDYYETSDGRYLSLGSLEPVFANKVLMALDMADWASKLSDQRHKIQREVREHFQSIFKQHSLAHWMAIFESLDACVEPVLTTQEALLHPHFIARGMISKGLFEDGTSVPQLNSALPFRSEKEHRVGKSLGADTELILGLIGFSSVEINALKEKGVIK